MTMIALLLTRIAAAEVAFATFALILAVMPLLLVKALAAAIIAGLLLRTVGLAGLATLIAVLMTAILVSAILALTVLVLIAVAALEAALTPEKNRLLLFGRGFCCFNGRCRFRCRSSGFLRLGCGLRLGNGHGRGHGFGGWNGGLWGFCSRCRASFLGGGLSRESVELGELRRHRGSSHRLVAITEAAQDFLH